MSIIESIWFGRGAGARTARALLRPASWLYGAGVSWRNARYDSGAMHAHRAVLPVLSLGNLTVGGTGKTPVAAWVAARLRSMGAAPAIVLRGYGADEPLVHARLNPDVQIIVDPDRVRGAETALTDGADVVVLDDGFQHRRLARSSDWVLIAAEQWDAGTKLLPSGPMRESLESLARAHVVVVTRRSAPASAAESIVATLSGRFPLLGFARCHLALGAIVDARSGVSRPLADLRGQRVLAAAGIGQPVAFFEQLRAAGADPVPRSYADHHAFSSADAAELAGAAAGLAGVVCTLKDAVKLAPLWPREAPPLWYVSQIAVIEDGESVLDRALHALLAIRPAASSTAGSAGPSF